MMLTKIVRTLLVPAMVGALSVGAAWAGVGLAPVSVTAEQAVTEAMAGAADGTAQAAAAATADADADTRGPTIPALAGQGGGQGGAGGPEGQGRPPLGDGELYAGAAAVSIHPDPDTEAGEVWATEGCATLGPDASSGLTHVADFRSPWPENPNCIYAGGYGLGPMNPITSVDATYGFFVRSVALSDGTGTVVLTILDGTSYMGDYNNFCDDCGAFELADSLGAELGIDPAGIMFASTHSHTAPDFIGGWGGVPEWYMEQVTEALRTSVRQAVSSMEPATVEAGETIARSFNGERRDFYRSAEEQTLAWVRAYTSNPGGQQAETIFTLGAYAAHPVTADLVDGAGHPDFPGVFAQTVEEDGGVGAFFMTGLGNMSPRGDTLTMGQGLAALVPAIGAAGRPVTGPVVVASARWDQPVTNPGLTALGTPGFFDRQFNQQPATVTVGKSENNQCTSASPVSVNTGVSAAKVGDLWITGAPGETFANLANAIRERNPGGITLPLAQVNDGLGYIIQSFEADTAARQTNGGFAGEIFEYEDAYSIDGCFGDMVLETTVGILGNL